MERWYDHVVHTRGPEVKPHKALKQRLRRIDREIEGVTNTLRRKIVIDLSNLSPPLTDEDCEILRSVVLNTQEHILHAVKEWVLASNRISSKGASLFLLTLRALGLDHAVDLSDNPFIEYLGCRSTVSENLGLSPCVGDGCFATRFYQQVAYLKGRSGNRRLPTMRSLKLDKCPIYAASTCMVENMGNVDMLSVRFTNFTRLWCLLEVVRRLRPKSLYIKQCFSKQQVVRQQEKASIEAPGVSVPDAQSFVFSQRNAPVVIPQELDSELPTNEFDQSVSSQSVPHPFGRVSGGSLERSTRSLSLLTGQQALSGSIMFRRGTSYLLHSSDHTRVSDSPQESLDWRSEERNMEENTSENLNVAIIAESTHQRNQVSPGENLLDTSASQDEEEDVLRRQTPICDDAHYREFFIAQCSWLETLDGIPIDKNDRQFSKTIFCEHFQNTFLFDRRPSLEHHLVEPSDAEDDDFCLNVEHFTKYLGHSRLTAQCSRICHYPYRPRQFEYHPTLSELMAIGTLDGENSRSPKETVLALCWLSKYPDKLLIGTDHGTIQLLDISKRSCQPEDDWNVRTFESFELQTSLHANSTNQFFLTSGYSTEIGVYDIRTAVKVQTLRGCHSEHINVLRFANISPYLFATSSFDRSIKLFDIREPPIYGRQRPIFVRYSHMGSVMVCFSPDDQYLLSSAVDNEVYQYILPDGRLDKQFPIPPTRSPYNYTRSYYLNGKDYMITGSCEEKVVRVYNTMNGKLFRQVEIDSVSSMQRQDGDCPFDPFMSKDSPYIQSLRGDPFHPFSFSVLLSHCRLSVPSEIIKVDLLKPFDDMTFSRGLVSRGGA
eukprot:jgi/Galph1/1838/GphlegSOOS_G511.1